MSHKNASKKENINHEDLVNLAVTSLGGTIEKSVIDSVIRTVSAEIVNGMKNNKIVKLLGVASFGIGFQKAHTRVNPKTGAKVEIADRVNPTFSFSKTVKDEIRALPLSQVSSNLVEVVE